MKTAFFSAFAAFVLLLTACNSKPEKTSEISDKQDYQELQVGVRKEGLLSVTNQEIIKKEWEKRLADDNTVLSLRDFKIVEGTTAGDSTEQFYMLVANTADGKMKAASLLVLKENVFYFDTYQDQDGSNFYSNIICEGDCTEGCDPIVTISNGRRYLNCSQCVDCVKKEGEIR